MLNYEFITSAEKLIGFISSNKFEDITQRTPYYHMGATITDSVLQAGLNYNHVVYPRVLSLLKEYPDYKTTCDFLILMQIIPLTDLISWKNKKKLERIENLSYFFYNQKIENEDQLALWLNSNDNLPMLSKLEGVGPKTIDYLKMLSGNQSIAVDRHLFKFLELAGITKKTYQEAHSIYCKAAEILNITQYELDKKIWLYMSGAKI